MKTVEKTEAEPPTLEEAMGELAAEIQRQARLGGTGLLDWLEERLDVKAAARLAGLRPSCLYKLNCGTNGPIHEKPSGHLRYRRADLLSWLQSLRVDQVERIEGRVRTTRRPVPVIGGSALNALRHARVQPHRAS